MGKRIIRAKRHRLPRECYRGQVDVAFTACIVERKEPFRDAEIVSAFVEKLTVAAKSNQCRVPIYCFMPDHVHILMHGDTESADVWGAMSAFKQQTGFWFGRQRPEMAWLGDFFDHVIRTADEFTRQARYIAENPVRRGLAQQWSDYSFTGAIGFDVREVIEGLDVFWPYSIAVW